MVRQLKQLALSCRKSSELRQRLADARASGGSLADAAAQVPLDDKPVKAANSAAQEAPATVKRSTERLSALAKSARVRVTHSIRGTTLFHWAHFRAGSLPAARLFITSLAPLATTPCSCSDEQPHDFAQMGDICVGAVASEADNEASCEHAM